MVLFTETPPPPAGPGTGLLTGPVTGLGGTPPPRKDLEPEAGKGPGTRGWGTPLLGEQTN